MRDQHLSLHLDSEQVILRTIGDEEPEPVQLSGAIVLDLHERTHINDIVLVFNGRAHITYTDTSTYKTHTIETPVYHHDQSFLPSFNGPASQATASATGTPGSRPGSAVPSRRGSFAGQADASAASENSEILAAGTASAGSSILSGSGSGAHTPASASGGTPGHGFAHYAASVAQSSSKSHHHHGHHHHSHTLNAGHHRFPFSLTVPGSLPASVRMSGLNASTISYQLKATVHKSGVFGGKWSVKRPVILLRGLLPEAAEFNQTLEIDNTWPGKLMYNFTLPQKAFCAGETIPIALKFTPIAKGVKVTQLVTSIKEHVTVMNKHGQPHSTTRDIVTKKHNFIARSSLATTGSNTSAGPNSLSGGRASSTVRAQPVSVPASRSGSHTDLASLGQQASRLNFEDHPMLAGASSTSSPIHTASPQAVAGPSTSASAYTPVSGQSSNSASRAGSRNHSPERIYYGRNQNDPDFVGLVDDDAGEEVDVDAVIEISLPLGATNSHSLEPVMVSHKVKWSAFIRNLDGHTSELRCALPIYLLSPLLAEEARLASSGTRSLLFGPSGVLVPTAEGITQVDLPSYADHVRDRVASIDASGTNTTLASSAGQANPSFVRSPWATPVVSPENHSPEGNFHAHEGYFPSHATRNINWADSELLSSLAIASPVDERHLSHTPSHNSSSHGSPATSRPGSRPGSRPSSRPSSRPGSRASSPVRGESTNHSSSNDGLAMGLPVTIPGHPAHHEQDPHQRGASLRSASGGFLSHLPKPLRPFTALGGHAHSQPNSAHISRGSTSPADERSHSTGSLSSFFHSHALGHGKSSLSRHSTEAPHEVAPVPGPANGLPPGDLQAALEEAQRTQQDKGKRRAHFSLGHNKGKGKQRASTFASLHDEEHDHDLSEDHSHHSGAHSPAAAEEDVQPDDDGGARFLSQVPSYQVAAKGFLGGGVVPISAAAGLPSYDQSEALSRPGTPLSPLTRTDTAATRSSTSTTNSSVHSSGRRSTSIRH